MINGQTPTILLTKGRFQIVEGLGTILRPNAEMLRSLLAGKPVAITPEEKKR